MRKGVSIPFSVQAEVSARPVGTLSRLHAVRRKAAGMPAGRLLDFFESNSTISISPRETYGLRIEDNDIFVDPGRVLPPPRVRGRLTAARIEGTRLVQVFGSSQRAENLLPPEPRANYLYFRGGTLGFGRSSMTPADLQLIDADPNDPFDFFPQKYQRQLVAGYSKNTPSGGLRTYMPDQDDVLRDPKLDLTRPLRTSRSGTARSGTN